MSLPLTMILHDILAAHAASQLRDLPETLAQIHTELVTRYKWGERDLDPPDRGSLTDAEVNSVQQEIERRASNEFDEVTDRVRDWLVNNPRVRADYCQYRSALLSEEEEREICASLGICR